MIMHPDIGVLNGGNYYVFLEGYGLNREAMYGTYEDCLNAIDERGGVDDPIPTDGSFTMADYKAALEASKLKPTAAATVAQTQRATRSNACKPREYILTFTANEPAYCNGRMADISTEIVLADDRKDALRKGRAIIRECEGRYGRKIAIAARLAG